MLKLRQKKVNVDPRKKISTGYRSVEKDLPKKAGHFVVAHPEEKEEVYYPELVELYGDKPIMFYIAFPSNNIEDFFKAKMNIWGSNKVKKRSCDQNICEHYLDETVGGVDYKAGVQSECVCHKNGFIDDSGILAKGLNKLQKSQCCKPDIYLSCWILNPKTLQIINPLPYLIESHSQYSYDNIYSELLKYRELTSKVFVITVKTVKGVNTSYDLLQLYPFVSNNLLSGQTQNFKLIGEIDEETRTKLLEQGDFEDIDDIQDGTYEHVTNEQIAEAVEKNKKENTIDEETGEINEEKGLPFPEAEVEEVKTEKISIIAKHIQECKERILKCESKMELKMKMEEYKADPILEKHEKETLRQIALVHYKTLKK